MAFCQNTFDWGDYIDQVWDDWLTDPNGRLFVAELGSECVGLLHVCFLPGGEAWMEGMRVDPNIRRAGVGSELDQSGREAARESGCRVARLVTSVNNITAQKTLVSLGYSHIARFNEWLAEPHEAADTGLRLPQASDLVTILAHWRDSDIRSASGMVLPDQNWRWTTLDETRLRRQVQAGELRIAPGGFAIFCPWSDEDGCGISVQALVGAPETLEVLARGARIEANLRGLSEVRALVAEHLGLNQVLERSGYSRTSGLLIYEQSL